MLLFCAPCYKKVTSYSHWARNPGQRAGAGREERGTNAAARCLASSICARSSVDSTEATFSATPDCLRLCAQKPFQPFDRVLGDADAQDASDRSHTVRRGLPPLRRADTTLRRACRLWARPGLARKDRPGHIGRQRFPLPRREQRVARPSARFRSTPCPAWHSSPSMASASAFPLLAASPYQCAACL